MLILTRRPVEAICIGDDVRLILLGVKGTQVRFGIEAPPHVSVDREEIRELKRRQKAKRDENGDVDGNKK